MQPEPFTADQLAMMGGLTPPPLTGKPSPGERFLREIARAVHFYKQAHPKTDDLVETPVIEAIATSVLSYTDNTNQAAYDLGKRDDSDPKEYLLYGARTLAHALLSRSTPQDAADRVEKYLAAIDADVEEIHATCVIGDSGIHNLRASDLRALIEAVRS